MRITLDQLNSELTVSELLKEMVPPAEFSSVSFSNYVPDSSFPSQSEALHKAGEFAKSLAKNQKTAKGIYFDGGFGVGKTHLLASVYHACPRAKLFGSFISFTSTIGYLGFQEAVTQFKKYELLCIDEFELDDPGDTMIMSRFLKELAEKGVNFAATSNTPPNALGQGRFAADNFKREIESVANIFEICRIDGEDYRHRGTDYRFQEISLKERDHLLSSEKAVLEISQEGLLGFLGSIHQSRYVKIAEQIDVLIVDGVKTIHDQFEGIRFVSFIDRAYEAGIALRFSGESLNNIFRDDHLTGAYQKKYRRCLSRLAAMSNR